MSEPLDLYVVFELNSQRFAVSADCVQEMVVLDIVCHAPASLPFVRGMMLLRGQVLSIIDLRLLLGMRSYQDVHREAIEDFRKRKQDHINWLTELENSVRENRGFGLTTDPHKCAFGRWYDNFRTDDPVLSLKLQQFERPHQHIHALAAQARAMVERGQLTEANCMIDAARERELATLLRLFDETLPLLVATSREVVVVVSDGAHRIGLVVDDVSGMQEFKPQEIDVLPADSFVCSAGNCVRGIGRNDDRGTVLLDCGRILEQSVAHV